jgi:hypothetical protein
MRADRAGCRRTLPLGGDSTGEVPSPSGGRFSADVASGTVGRAQTRTVPPSMSWTVPVAHDWVMQ